ncbi:hypothetical protein [Saccharothrix texasensis]|uniref:Uncharacterized protein n=1 Tax=Saccharothrix texasensis TaxID=103734 RepID=A0A3N1H7Q8_9PSEU|nr:hypothetical protein [Saccharothrix texasensis]ROP38584.1 hypothetical protein EDD40_3942 [Saccharothrix texasensis]
MSNHIGGWLAACANWRPRLRLSAAIVIICIVTVVVTVAAQADVFVALSAVTALFTTALGLERHLARRRRA